MDTGSGALGAITVGTRDVSANLPLEERLVGRDVELLVLSTAFERLVPGTPEFVFVRGPSGIGKTALVRELAPRFASLRAHVSFGKFEGQNVDLVLQGGGLKLNWLDTNSGKTEALDCKPR